MRPRVQRDFDGEVPPELADRDAAVWHDPDLFEAYLAAHGWWDHYMATRGWLAEQSPSPRRRRAYAVRRWAVEAGIVVEGTPRPDWHSLKGMGLL